MRRRALPFLVPFCFVLLVWTAPAGAGLFTQTASGAGTYPPSSQSSFLELRPTAGLPGSVVNVAGRACLGTATLTVLFDTSVIGTTAADPSGAFSTSVTIPTGATAGAHSITVSGAGCPLSATFTVLTVLAQALPFTGAPNIRGLLEVTAGLVLLGMVLILVARRRRAINR